MGFPCGLAGKESARNAARPRFDPWFAKIPRRRERLPTPVFRPGEFHELYSPWGHKESDTTERLSLWSPGSGSSAENREEEAHRLRNPGTVRLARGRSGSS